jgi:hypothetical protein
MQQGGECRSAEVPRRRWTTRLATHMPPGFRPVLRIHALLLFSVFSPFFFTFLFVFLRPHSSLDDDAIPHLAAFWTRLRVIDDLLDEALHVSLSIYQNYQCSGANPKGADARYTNQSPLVSSALDLDALRAQACQILQGKSIFLVGPHEVLYQLHSYLLEVLHPDPIPDSIMAPTKRPSCPGAPLSSCPSHILCHPTIKLPLLARSRSSSVSVVSGASTSYDHESPTPTDILPTNRSGSSLLRFLNSGNLNPSPTQGDAQLSVPSIDPRTGVRVIDSRWVRYAASPKTDILVLNRGPLPAPAWSYSINKNASCSRNLTWLTKLRALEQEHAEPLSDLFVHILSRLDHHDDNDDDNDDDHLRFPSTEPDTTKLVINAALHSTISTFLPSLLSTLCKLRDHTGHRAILGTKKPVLWYGSWFLPLSCAPDSLSVFSSETDPQRLLVRLLAQAEAMGNPWSAYYNAQGSYNEKK